MKPKRLVVVGETARSADEKRGCRRHMSETCLDCQLCLFTSSLAVYDFRRVDLAVLGPTRRPRANEYANNNNTTGTSQTS